MRKILSYILLTVMLFSLASCGSGEEASVKPFDTKAESADFDERVICENSSLRLEWVDDT